MIHGVGVREGSTTSWRSCALPNMVVIDPADAVEMDQATRAARAYEGPTYTRLLRGQVPVVLDEATYRCEIGRARTLRDGRDVGIAACGLMVARALDAAEELASMGIAGADHTGCAAEWGEDR